MFVDTGHVPYFEDNSEDENSKAVGVRCTETVILELMFVNVSRASGLACSVS